MGLTDPYSVIKGTGFLGKSKIFTWKSSLFSKNQKKIFAIFLKIWKKSRDTYKMCREFLYIGNRDLTFFYKDFNFREKISWFFSVFKNFFKQIKIAIFLSYLY